MREKLQRIHDLLLAAYGPQHWWPADSPFEVMIGAILTQNTNWRNVEKAIANLKCADALNAEAISGMDEANLRDLIRPSGFFNQKAVRIKLFCAFYIRHGKENGLKKLPAPRASLLEIKGIGPETADAMLLYALAIPVFVVDAYTRRIFSRLGLLSEAASYDATQALFMRHLPPEVSFFNAYHALIVQHAKQHCRVKPDCADCPLQQGCVFSENHDIYGTSA
ncbi:MAG: endonuclease III domain-containing protein [Mariprofundaceae bacterium]